MGYKLDKMEYLKYKNDNALNAEKKENALKKR